MAAAASKSDLAKRIQSEFEARAARRQDAEKERAKQSAEREKRLEQFAKVCDDLREIWGPRIEEFATQFGERVKVTPTVSPEQRQAKITFNTDLANMVLTMSAAASSDATKLVLHYDLLIIPMMFEYERHSRLEVPIEKVDRDAISKWVDDRLISCVQAYFSMMDNEFYLKRAMVEDPITKAKFLREDAKATLEHGGKTYYFSSDESMQKFKAERQQPTPRAPKPAPTTSATAN